MSEPQKSRPSGDDLPQAKVKRTRWGFPVVWVVPVLAAIVAGYLVYHRVQDYGPKILIRFRDGSGLKTGRETSVKYRGVSVGEVTGIELSKDQQYVEVT